MAVFVDSKGLAIEVRHDVLLIIDDSSVQNDLIHFFAKDEDAAVSVGSLRGGGGRGLLLRRLLLGGLLLS